MKGDHEFQIKITKALENLWIDEQARREQLGISESMKFFISYKNNLEHHPYDQNYLPHNQIHDNETWSLLKININSYFKENLIVQAQQGELNKNYSKCFFSNYMHQNFLSFLQNEKVFYKNLFFIIIQIFNRMNYNNHFLVVFKNMQKEKKR